MNVGIGNKVHAYRDWWSRMHRNKTHTP